MNKKGFTLAELLGVIVILAAVSLIAFPPIINQIKKSRGELNDALNTLIYTAARQYLEENNYSLDNTNYCIKLNVLVEDGKLVEPITDSKGNIVNLNSIFYIQFPSQSITTGGDDTFNSSLEYDLYDNDENLDCDISIPNI